MVVFPSLSPVTRSIMGQRQLQTQPHAQPYKMVMKPIPTSSTHTAASKTSGLPFLSMKVADKSRSTGARAKALPKDVLLTSTSLRIPFNSSVKNATKAVSRPITSMSAKYQISKRDSNSPNATALISQSRIPATTTKAEAWPQTLLLFGRTISNLHSS
jgi:hypothetical protein